MQTKMQYTALVASLMLIMPTAAFAIPTPNSNYLQAAMARVTCDTNYVTGFINDVTTNIPSASSLSQNANTINTETTTLQGYVTGNDKTSFTSFVKSTYHPELKSTWIAIHEAIKTGNVTKNVRDTLKSDHASLMITYKGCSYAAWELYANSKTIMFQNDVSKMQNRSSTLGAKGIDTTSLNQVISNADDQIAKLKSAISAANDTKSLRSALQSNCLYNGCKNGENFHFAAKASIAVHRAILDHIQIQANSSEYSSQIKDGQNDLNAAESILDTVGSGQYTPTQKVDVWNDLKAAGSIIHQLWKEISHK